MKIIFSLSLLLLASSDCFSMKKRQIDYDNDNGNKKQFSQTNTNVTPLRNKGEKRYSTEENNQPNHIPFTRNNIYIDLQTQIKFRQLQQQQNFIEQQHNPEFITILQKDGTYRYLHLNNSQN